MASLIEFFSTMPFWYWWVFAAGLLVIELLTGSTYFLWPALSAALVGFFSVWPLGDAWQMQLFIFAAFTVALSAFAPRYVKPWLNNSQADHFTLNERGAQKIGRRVSVDENFERGAGKVRMGDTLWLAESETGEDFIAGAEVEVTRTEGTKLYVKAV
ncbi:MAG: membrane protein [Hyphococcus sp.]|nr:MAG: membrane protein [Marinicaulis sp.]